MQYAFKKLSDLKNRARRVAREESLSRHAALDVTAQRANFQNYAHALTCLPNNDSDQASHKIEIRQSWRRHGDERGRRGVGAIEVWLSRPLTELVRPHQLEQYLAACEIRSDDLLISDGLMRDDQETRIDLGKIARALQFVDVTGLKPTPAKRIYPKGDWYKRPPIADHDHGWFDPVARVHVLSTEPYRERAHLLPEQEAWEATHGWTTVSSTWGSIYGFGTSLYLLCPQAYAPTLRKKVASLQRSASALSNDQATIEEIGKGRSPT